MFNLDIQHFDVWHNQGEKKTQNELCEKVKRKKMSKNESVDNFQ